MVNKSDLVENDLYWYVYSPMHGLTSQAVRLELLFFEGMDSEKPCFKVMCGDMDDPFPTVDIEIEDEDYVNLFHFSHRDDAKKIWAREFFKNFNDVYGIEFSEFITLCESPHPKGRGFQLDPFES